MIKTFGEDNAIHMFEEMKEKVLDWDVVSKLSSVNAIKAAEKRLAASMEKISNAKQERQLAPQEIFTKVGLIDIAKYSAVDWATKKTLDSFTKKRY